MEKFLMGKVAKPKGLDGTLKIDVVSADVENLTKLKVAYIGGEKFEIEGAYASSGFLFAKFKGINSIDDAEKFRLKSFEIDRSDASALEEDEYYVADLIGSEVFFESETKIGKIFDVNNYGASDVLTIKTRREELLVPLVPGLVVSFLANEKKLVINESKFNELV